MNAFSEDDKKVQTLNFDPSTKCPKTTKSTKDGSTLAVVLPEKVEICPNDDNDQGKGRARLPDTRERTVGEAREFVRKHWGEKMARDEFPHSSENDEVVNIDQIADMFFRDSRDINFEVEELEFNEKMRRQ